MVQLVKRGTLVVISGFSGVGKGTVIRKLLQDSSNYVLSISMTTRTKRPEEVDKVDYFFVDRREFGEIIARDGFVEHTSYLGNYYGTPKDYVMEQMDKGKDVILEVESQGALQIKEKFPNTLLIYVMPPSVEELERRLNETAKEGDTAVRLQKALKEVEWTKQYDFVVVNDDIEECVRQLHAIILASPSAVSRNVEYLRGIGDALHCRIEG